MGRRLSQSLAAWMATKRKLYEDNEPERIYSYAMDIDQEPIPNFPVEVVPRNENREEAPGVKELENYENVGDEMDTRSDHAVSPQAQKKRKKGKGGSSKTSQKASTVITPFRRERAKKRRWVNQGPEPVYKWSQLPKGWSHLELDLDNDDLDAQVERCRERIGDGYMPHIFEKRLKTLLAAQERRWAMVSTYPPELGLSVIRRLESLKNIKRHLEDSGDEYEELPNVNAIMNAYLSGELTWLDGLVTYWSKGKQLGPSTAFDWDGFLELSYKNQGHKGFWVEGVFGIEGFRQAVQTMVVPPVGEHHANPGSYYTNEYLLTVRHAKWVPRPPSPTPSNPSTSDTSTPSADSALVRGDQIGSGVPFPDPMPEVELLFLDDTGADVMKVFLDDMTALTPQPTDFWPFFEWYQPSIVGFAEIGNASGGKEVEMIICVEVNMRAHGPESGPSPPFMKSEWTRVLCSVSMKAQSEEGAPKSRLAGPWLRHVLYTATAPNNKNELVISTHKTGLRGLESVDHNNARGPRPWSPDYYVLWDYATERPMLGGLYEDRPAAGTAPGDSTTAGAGW